jgi:ribonuclease HI
MKVISNKAVYAAIRYDISEQVEVFIDSSFNIKATRSPDTLVTIGVGWSMLDKHGRFAGYGVSGITPRNPKTPEMAELLGILDFFSVMKMRFRDEYDKNTKFTVRNDNQKLMTYLAYLSTGKIPPSDLDYIRETASSVSGKETLIKGMLQDFNVEFQWIKGHVDNHFNNIADRLAYTCFITERKGVRFTEDVRMQGIKDSLGELHQSTGGHFKRFDVINNNIGDLLKEQQDKLEALFRPASISAVTSTPNPAEKISVIFKPKEALAYPQVINDDTVYSAIRHDLTGEVKVFVNSSYDLISNADDEIQYLGSRGTPEHLVNAGVGWAFLDDKEQFSGYGVAQMSMFPTSSSMIADLRGVLMCFDVIQNGFGPVYDETTKFIVYSPNEQLVKNICHLMDKAVSPSDSQKRDFRNHLRSLKSRLKHLIENFDIEFRWIGEDHEKDMECYGSFAGNLASTCCRFDHEDQAFTGELRMSHIKESLSALKRLTNE